MRASADLITGVSLEAGVVSSRKIKNRACNPRLGSVSGRRVMEQIVSLLSSVTLFSGKITSTYRLQKSVSSTAEAARESSQMNFCPAFVPETVRIRCSEWGARGRLV